MEKLLKRAILTLASLFGLVFAVGVAIFYYLDLSILWAIAFAIAVAALQYAYSPRLM